MTKKQKRFVDEYLIDLNATQAAIRAGYKAKNGQRSDMNYSRKPKFQKQSQRQSQKDPKEPE